MTINCPCCGSQMAATVPVEKLHLLVSPTMWRIIEVLRRRPGLNAAQLADVVYANDPNGGPDTATNCVASTISRSNPVLRGYGWQVAAGMGRRSGYVLRAIAAEVAA